MAKFSSSMTLIALFANEDDGTELGNASPIAVMTGAMTCPQNFIVIGFTSSLSLPLTSMTYK